MKEKTQTGIKIRSVSKESIAYKEGLRIGDIILSVNGYPTEHELEFSFYAAEPELELEIQRGENYYDCFISRPDGSYLGIEFDAVPVKQCTNKCLFCFIDQMPKGLRSSLYVKDEDYRHSFLNGNYVTLTSTTDDELQKIAELGLSPLYISVHATDPDIRIKLLQNRFAGKILDQLQFLNKNNINFHTQIVVCPQINDGDILIKSINDLLALSPELQSIAIVPVGLTKLKNPQIRAFTNDEAKSICDIINTISDKDKNQFGFRRIFLADEFFIKANIALPNHTYYEKYPQIENGVGLISLLQQEWNDIKSTKQNKIDSNRKVNILVATSIDACPFLESIFNEIAKCNPWLHFIVTPIENLFLGKDVTVAGLLTAQDIIRSIKKETKRFDSIIIPGECLNYKGFTIDGFSIKRISKKLQKPIYSAKSIKELIKIFEIIKG